MAFSLKSFFGNLGRGRVRVVDAMHDLPTQANIPARWSNRFMGPGSPLGNLPTARGRDAETEPRTFQYPTNVNATIAPRAAYDLMPFTQLREYAEAVPEVAECIRIITEEIKAFKPRIIDGQGNEVSDPSLEWMIESPDRFNPWPVWLSRFLYNMLVYDAGAVHTPRSRDGSIRELRVIDGSTLFVMVDEYGELPAPPAPAFSQVLYGVPRNYFNTHQIWYRPRHLRADAPYGRSPIEDCLPAVRVLAKMWGYQESWYTEGTTPDTMLTSPEKWTPEQILQFESDFNARMAGNTEERAGRIRFLPPGVQSLATKEATFNQAMYDAAANSVRMSFGIPRTEFGESPASGLGGSGFLDAMQDVFYRTGLSPVKAYIEGLFNYALEANGYPDYSFELAFPKESIDPKKEEDRATDRFTKGIATRDETREKLGMEPLGGEEGAYLVNPSQPAGDDMSGAGIGLGGGSIPVRQDKIKVTNKIPVTGRMIPVDDGMVDVRDPIDVIAKIAEFVDDEDLLLDLLYKAEFNESDHPRADDGKFSSTGSGGMSSGSGDDDKPHPPLGVKGYIALSQKASREKLSEKELKAVEDFAQKKWGNSPKWVADHRDSGTLKPTSVKVKGAPKAELVASAPAAEVAKPAESSAPKEDFFAAFNAKNAEYGASASPKWEPKVDTSPKKEKKPNPAPAPVEQPKTEAEQPAGSGKQYDPKKLNGRFFRNDDGSVEIEVDYNKNFITKARKIGGAWDKDKKRWVFGPENGQQAKEMFDKSYNNFNDDSVRQASKAAAEKSKAEAQSKKYDSKKKNGRFYRNNDGSVEIAVDYDPDIVKQFKKLGGKWSYDSKRWKFDSQNSLQAEDAFDKSYNDFNIDSVIQESKGIKDQKRSTIADELKQSNENKDVKYDSSKKIGYMSVKNGGGVLLHGDYDAEFVEKIKKIPGRTWDNSAGGWVVPYDSYETAKAIFNAHYNNANNPELYKAYQEEKEAAKHKEQKEYEKKAESEPASQKQLDYLDTLMSNFIHVSGKSINHKDLGENLTKSKASFWIDSFKGGEEQVSSFGYFYDGQSPWRSDEPVDY